MQGFESDAAHHITQGNDNEAKEHIRLPGPGETYVEHVCHAVLCSAEDKAHYAENDPKVFSYLVAVILKSFNCDVNKEVTEYSQDKEANVRVSQLYIAKAKGFL